MRLTRRRFLLLATATAAVGRIDRPRWEWRGSALGADARIVLEGPRDMAEVALAEVTAEIDRLEDIFSLSRPESQLSRLNAAGMLETPAHDLTAVLAAADHWKAVTQGAFDPTVQPLWEHWARGIGSTEAALERVRSAGIRHSGGRVRLVPGTALTLNGIAQGTVADRVAQLLTRRGFVPPLIDTGEMRLAGPERRAVDLPEVGLRLRLAETAMATSTPGALRFDAAGQRHHIFDPRSGESPGWWQSVTVLAPTAEAADALSTAFAVAAPDMVGDVAATLSGVAVLATDRGGRTRTFGDRALLSGGNRA